MAASSQSMKLQLISKVGLSFVSVALILSLLLGWVFSTRPIAAIDQNKLEDYQNNLTSYAIEGVLLAKQYQARRPTSNYATVSFSKLFEATSDTADKLQEEQPEPGLEQKVKKTADQASQLADTLTKLSAQPEQGELANLISKLNGINEQLEEIGT
jgi:hypothetical protein